MDAGSGLEVEPEEQQVEVRVAASGPDGVGEIVQLSIIQRATSAGGAAWLAERGDQVVDVDAHCSGFLEQDPGAELTVHRTRCSRRSPTASNNPAARRTSPSTVLLVHGAVVGFGWFAVAFPSLVAVQASGGVRTWFGDLRRRSRG
ncbi:MAG: hypothetical protein Q8K58_16035 [Acidimicrobiales bacterium]|nr:hypothetical protein [Acidimicrobiales bacterium]